MSVESKLSSFTLESWSLSDRTSPSFTSSHVTLPRRGSTSCHWPCAVNQNTCCVHQVQDGTLITLISHTYRHSCAFSPDICPVWSYALLSNFPPNPDLSHVIHFPQDEPQIYLKNAGCCFSRLWPKDTAPLITHFVFMYLTAMLRNTLYSARDVKVQINVVSRGTVISRPFYM
jgi:hypothetical protein